MQSLEVVNSKGQKRRKQPVSTAPSNQNVERHLRMGEAARLLGVSRATLYRWLPRIKHVRIPAGGLTREIILIPESALAEFLAGHGREVIRNKNGAQILGCARFAGRQKNQADGYAVGFTQK